MNERNRFRENEHNPDARFTQQPYRQAAWDDEYRAHRNQNAEQPWQYPEARQGRHAEPGYRHDSYDSYDNSELSGVYGRDDGGRFGGNAGPRYAPGYAAQDFETSGGAPGYGAERGRRPWGRETQRFDRNRYPEYGYGQSDQDRVGRTGQYADQDRYQTRSNRWYAERDSASQDYDRSFDPYGFGGRNYMERNPQWRPEREEQFRTGDYRQASDYRYSDHAGRGPRDYTRSDERLKEDLCERLTRAPHIDASDISVEVNDGRVTLNGKVDSRHTKYNVENLVDVCMGVKEIDNRLGIEASSGLRQGTERSESQSNGSAGRDDSTRNAGAGRKKP